jgi:hypothetical protein
MRMGLIGPAAPGSPELGRALALFGADDAVRRIVYLGADTAVDGLSAPQRQPGLEEPEFLARAAALACDGSADEIGALLAQERSGGQLQLLRKLPEPPARAIEMLDKWIVLAVYDKAVLDEDDIANAHIIVYGRSEEPGIKRFGPRCFFTPGPLESGKVGCIELMPQGHIEVRLLDLSGAVLFREALYGGGGAKLVVSS